MFNVLVLFIIIIFTLPAIIFEIRVFRYEIDSTEILDR